MKRILWLSMLLFLLTGCGFLSRSTALEPIPLPSAALPSGQTAIESSPTPIPTASEQLYQNDALHLSLRYPSGWQFVDGDRVSGEKFAGADGFFRTGAMSGGGMTLDEVAQSEAQHVLMPFGSSPSVESLQIQGQEARLILPSADQPKTAANEPAWGELLVRYPRPVLVNRGLVEFFVLYGDVNHIRDLAATITFGDPPGVFYADSDTPAAGICADTSGSLVTLTISSDVPSPRCAKMAPSQVISFTNQTGSPVTLTLAWYTIPLGPNETFTFDAPVGAFLAPGVHIPTIRGGGNAPELWLAKPESVNTVLTPLAPETSPYAVAGSDPPFVQPGEVISVENASRLRELTSWDSTAVKSVQFIPGLDKAALGLEDQVILYAPQDPQTIERLPLPGSDIPWMNPGLLFSPDGSLVARLRGECPSDNSHCQIEVRSRSGGSSLLKRETDILSAIAISPDNRYLILGTSAGLTVYRLSDAKQIAILPESIYFDRLAISPDGSLAAGFVYTGDYVNIYRLPSGDLAYRLQPQAYAGAFYPNDAVFSPDGKILAVGANGLIGLWQAKDGLELRFWQPHNVEIGAMAFSPDGKLLVSGDSDGNLVISDVAQGKAVHNFKAHRGLIWRAFFASQGRLLCTFGQDGLLRVWGIPPN